MIFTLLTRCCLSAYLTSDISPLRLCGEWAKVLGVAISVNLQLSLKSFHSFARKVYHHHLFRHD